MFPYSGKNMQQKNHSVFKISNCKYQIQLQVPNLIATINSAILRCFLILNFTLNLSRVASRAGVGGASPPTPRLSRSPVYFFITYIINI